MVKHIGVTSLMQCHFISQQCQQRWQQSTTQDRHVHTGCPACTRSINTWNQRRACPAAAPESRGWGRTAKGRRSIIPVHWTINTHTQPQARRTSLTCFQLEVVCRKGLPRQGQGCHRLEMWYMLLYICCGIANAVRKKPFNYSSWHKNQSAPCNVVTNCYVIWLLQDFNLKHTGKHFFFFILFAVQPLFDGTSHPEGSSLAGFLSCNPL